MTITNEPTTTEPTIPAWIDVDMIVSPELRAEAQAEVDTMRAFMAECRDRAARYQLLLERVKDSFDAAHVSAVDPNFDGLYEVLRRVTGVEPLEVMGWLVGYMFSPDPATTPTDDWLAEQAIRLGLGGLIVSAVSGNVDEYKSAGEEVQA